MAKRQPVKLQAVGGFFGAAENERHRLFTHGGVVAHFFEQLNAVINGADRAGNIVAEPRVHQGCQVDGFSHKNAPYGFLYKRTDITMQNLIAMQIRIHEQTA